MNDVIEQAPKGLWRDSRKYFGRWLLLGALGGLATPVVTPGDFGAIKMHQLMDGVIYGLLCGLLFTVIQNTLNQGRARWKSWLLIFVSSILVKLVFLGIYWAQT